MGRIFCTGRLFIPRKGCMCIQQAVAWHKQVAATVILCVMCGIGGGRMEEKGEANALDHSPSVFVVGRPQAGREDRQACMHCFVVVAAAASQ